ncbi:glycosyltransferase [Lactobacillus hamsteri]|nr:glycosyltransferase [Lactobacillus hamsteri]
MAEKIGSAFTSKIICISDFEKNTALKNKIAPEDKLKVIYSGIDFSKFKQANKITRTDVGIPKDAFIIGNVARITETKAPDTFVKTAKIIKKNIPNAFFVMVGNGDLQEKIKLQIKANHLDDSFLLTGWVDNPNEFMNLFDVGMLLSRWEGLGLVLLEYMFLGIPVIATNVGGIPNVVNNKENGLLVSKDNINEIVMATLLLHDDATLKQKLIENGTKDVKSKFDIKRTALETEKLYRRVLEDSIKI